MRRGPREKCRWIPTSDEEVKRALPPLRTLPARAASGPPALTSGAARPPAAGRAAPRAPGARRGSGAASGASAGIGARAPAGRGHRPGLGGGEPRQARLELGDAVGEERGLLGAGLGRPEEVSCSATAWASARAASASAAARLQPGRLATASATAGSRGRASIAASRSSSGASRVDERRQAGVLLGEEPGHAGRRPRRAPPPSLPPAGRAALRRGLLLGGAGEAGAQRLEPDRHRLLGMVERLEARLQRRERGPRVVLGERQQPRDPALDLGEPRLERRQPLRTAPRR